jgi:hypothetical protein
VREYYWNVCCLWHFFICGLQFIFGHQRLNGAFLSPMSLIFKSHQKRFHTPSNWVPYLKLDAILSCLFHFVFFVPFLKIAFMEVLPHYWDIQEYDIYIVVLYGLYSKLFIFTNLYIHMCTFSMLCSCNSHWLDLVPLQHGHYSGMSSSPYNFNFM